ncbi:putative Meckelin (Transmembrane protein 67) [Leishmania naiffi]|uniref:Meckelin (Transmembrane protein 67) n=1 Tax=Leishmania naiffi TaxID=5678 RepID=A0AAW3BJH2_9TRYP
MYMNGPQRGDPGSKDPCFIDGTHSYDRALLCRHDFDLFVLCAALFAPIDASLHKFYATMVLAFGVEILVHFYRTREGLVSLSEKTRTGEHFFI